MTTYVANGFSLNMIEGKATLIKEPVHKEQFLKACKTGKSIIGHPEIAETFNVELNRETVKLDYGDIVYVVSPRQRLKTEQYTFIEESEGYCYNRVIVRS